MQPQLQYATTRDGVHLAWYSIGAGLPILWMSSGPFTNIEYEWRIPETRAILETIAAAANLIRYDARGFSMSDRHVGEFSLEAMVEDLDTIVNACGRSPLVIMSPGIMSVPALVYASRHPERVSALVLTGGIARGADDVNEEYERTLRIARGDWEVAKRLLGGTSAVWAFTSTVTSLQEMLDRSTTQDAYIRWFESFPAWDATGVLPRVTMPTLITPLGVKEHRTQAQRRLAAALPAARITFEEPKDTNVVAQFLAETVGFAARNAPPPNAPPLRAAAIILFTDIVDSTALTERLGDARFREMSRALDAGLRTAIGEAGGAAVQGKLLGDGVLATFTSAAQAIDGARRCLALSAASELGLHIGLHAGDVIREEGNVFGGTVNIASRICSLSAPGEILVSDVVRGMARSSAGVMFQDRGEHEMKGIGDPVHIYAVRLGGA